ncbi:MAG: hypothetical protein ACKVT2_03035 [Saprospiraceae bacterium]
MNSQDFKKKSLLEALAAKGLLWSYQPAQTKHLADSIIIEHTLAFGDVPELQILFSIFPREEIKQVWIECLLPDERYRKSNRYLGLFFFEIQEIDQFLNQHANDYSRMEKLRLLAANNKGGFA